MIIRVGSFKKSISVLAALSLALVSSDRVLANPALELAPLLQKTSKMARTSKDAASVMRSILGGAVGRTTAIKVMMPNFSGNLSKLSTARLETLFGTLAQIYLSEGKTKVGRINAKDAKAIYDALMPQVNALYGLVKASANVDVFQGGATDAQFTAAVEDAMTVMVSLINNESGKALGLVDPAATEIPAGNAGSTAQETLESAAQTAGTSTGTNAAREQAKGTDALNQLKGMRENKVVGPTSNVAIDALNEQIIAVHGTNSQIAAKTYELMLKDEEMFQATNGEYSRIRRKDGSIHPDFIKCVLLKPVGVEQQSLTATEAERNVDMHLYPTDEANAIISAYESGFEGRDKEAVLEPLSMAFSDKFSDYLREVMGHSEESIAGFRKTLACNCGSLPNAAFPQGQCPAK